ncbi:MAG: hypothetical protein ACXAEX_09600 [Promethearchaeota archaeon]|jgi:hypothetical protein
MTDSEELKNEIPPYAFIALARRGMEKISLDQCFLENCDNENSDLLEPIKKEEYEDEKKYIKEISIRCKKCNRIFILKLETLKRVAKSTKDNNEEPLSMGMVSALDENKKNLGHIGYW